MYCVCRETRIVLFACKPFFLRGSDDLAVPDENCGAIVVEGGDSQNGCHAKIIVHIFCFSAIGVAINFQIFRLRAKKATMTVVRARLEHWREDFGGDRMLIDRDDGPAAQQNLFPIDPSVAVL